MNPTDDPNNPIRPHHLAPLLDALKADPARSAYYLDLLKPLQQYDTEHHGDLLNTLKAYLRHGGNSNHTADALFMHRNSLRYRMARIRAITTLDLDDPDSRLALQVAILLLTSNKPGKTRNDNFEL